MARHGLKPHERELQRWAQELHDETLQGLGAVRVLLSTARQHADREDLERTVDQVIEMLAEEIQKLRHLIVDLRPAELDDIGLEAAIEKLRRRIAVLGGPELATDVQLAYEMGSQPSRLTPELETAVYRIVQEAVTNAVKHSEATTVRVRIRDEGDEVTVEVADDGGGWRGVPSETSFGITGMRERAALISGRLEIASSGQGTSVLLTAPVQRRGAADPRTNGPPAVPRASPRQRT